MQIPLLQKKKTLFLLLSGILLTGIIAFLFAFTDIRETAELKKPPLEQSTPETSSPYPADPDSFSSSNSSSSLEADSENSLSPESTEADRSTRTS